MESLEALVVESVFSEAALSVRGAPRSARLSHPVSLLTRLCSPQRGVPSEAVTLLEFDSTQEVLWAGTDGGTVATFTAPGCARHAVVRGAHSGPLHALLPLPGLSACLSLSRGSLRVHSSGGLVQLRHEEPEAGEEGGFSAGTLEHAASLRCVLARASPHLQTYDVASAAWGALVDCGGTAGPVSCLAQGGRLLACGHASGELTLRDTRARLRCEASLAAHSGCVVALQAKGELIVSAGLQARRGGALAPEPLLKVWDVRGAPRPLAQVPFPGGACALRFLPRFTSSLLVVSPSAFFSLLDAAQPGGGGAVSTAAVDTQGAQLLSCGVGAAGEALAFGDAHGLVHLFATHSQPRFSLYDAHMEPGAPRRRLSPVGEQPWESAPIPPAPFAFGDGAPPLSAIAPPGQQLRVGQPPRVVDPQLLAQVKTVDFVGAVANPFYRRGQPAGEAARLAAPLRAARAGRGGGGGARGSARRRPPEAGALPKCYHYTEARCGGSGTGGPQSSSSASAPSASQRVTFDYDFSAFNATRLAGLENDLANAYVNPLLQLLCYTGHLRCALLRHVCEREFCLACELGFLAHALRVCPPGGTCRPANLLRTLRQIREAAALGLLEGAEEPGCRLEPSLPRRVQALARFALEQLAKEESAVTAQAAAAGGAPPRLPTVERVFSAAVRARTACAHCATETTRDNRSLALELQYPQQRPPPGQPRPTFAALLAASLAHTSDVRAWCEKERTYQRAVAHRALTTLPPSLMLCCGMRDEEKDLFWWGVPEAAIRAQAEAGKRAALAAAAATTGGAAEAPPAYDPADTEPLVERWLAPCVRVVLRGDGSVDVTQGASCAELQAGAAAGDGGVLYELTALVACIRPRCGEEEAVGGSAAELQRRVEGHLVCHQRVRPPYVDAPGAFLPTPGRAPGVTPGVSPLPSGAMAAMAARAAAMAAAEEPFAQPVAQPPRASTPPPGEPPGCEAEPPGTPSPAAVPPASDWVLFNDFTVTPTSEQEVLTLYGAAKLPCLLVYSRCDAPPPPPLPPPVMTEAAYARLTRARPPQPQATFRALDMSQACERPRAGMLLGIDAEFVALSPAEKSFRPDGSEAVLRPPRLSLARVSVVRGEGPQAMVPLQDDYVRSVEAVHDYLTRFSGIVAADLDPQLCRHSNGVTSLKAAYLKLRYLVDAGCVFCGHGLVSDFRCINLLVPPSQVVDTVELFHFKRQRKLSLRFLARRLLGVDIQRGSHDSVEDARTALALYAKYRQLRDAGQLQNTLLELYKHGKQWGWEGAGPGAVEEGAKASLLPAMMPGLPTMQRR